jgi:hypothetical protein
MIYIECALLFVFKYCIYIHRFFIKQVITPYYVIWMAFFFIFYVNSWCKGRLIPLKPIEPVQDMLSGWHSSSFLC